MKKTYAQPQLTAYGTVEQLTQSNGTSTSSDSIHFVGPTLPIDPLGGSRDITITINPR